MKIVVLRSGSSGNATLFEAAGTRVLVDAGISPRALRGELRAAGVDEAPDAIVLTHGHRDHVGQCVAIAEALGIPIHASHATARIAPLRGRSDVRVFRSRQPFSIGAVTISPMPVPHDAAQVALVVEGGGRRAALVTDLGEVPAGLREHLEGCEVALLESNHDLDMLRRGPYPPFLKRRIASSKGHLSNAQAQELLRALPREAHTVVLMHLSKTNNRPEIALASAREALSGRSVRVLAAPADEAVVVDAGVARVAWRARQLRLFRV